MLKVHKQLVGVFLIAALLIIQFAFPQSNYRFRHFDTRDGLASENVDYIRQDSLGFIWTANTSVLSRYDGYNFKNFQFDPNDSLSSPGGDWINRITVDRSGNLWVIRNGWMAGDNSFSLMRYDKKTDSFIKFKPVPRDVWISTAPSFETDEDVMWLPGRFGAGLFRFNYKTNEIKNYRNHHPDSMTQSRRNSIIYAENYGRFLLMTTDEGIWRFDKTTEKFSRPKCDPKDTSLFYLSSDNFIFSRPEPYDYNNLWVVFLGKEKELVRIDSNFSITSRFKFPDGFGLNSIDRDREGVIWLSSPDELLRYDPKDSSLTRIKNREGDPYSLHSGNGISDMIIDRDGNIWVATGKGISMLKGQSLAFYNHKIKKDPAIEAYNAEGKDFLIIAKRNPLDFKSTSAYMASITVGRLDSLNFQKIPLREPIKGNVYDFVTGQHHLWIGSSESGITGLTINPTTGMIEDKGTIRMRRNRENPNSIGSDNILGMLEEHGNLWFGATPMGPDEFGLNKVALNTPHGEKGSVTRYIHLPQDSNSVASPIVFRLFPADEKSFWVNTLAGIDLFHDGRFEHVAKGMGLVYNIFKAANGATYVGTSSGLYVSRKGVQPYYFEKDVDIKNYQVMGIHEDKLNRLWLSNFQGALMYDPKEKLQIEFTEEDGIDYTYENIERTSQGFLLMTDTEGISVFDPLALTISRHKTYPVLTKLLVNNQLPVVGNRPAGKVEFAIAQDISMLKELVIDYKHNNFVIEFSAMQMTAPKKNLYQYLLEGYDQDWIETDWKNRIATYTNLDAGHYTFKVKASNHHGVWSDQERTLVITVLPPPWKTSWAYSGYGLLIGSLLFLARRNIVQRERLKSNLKLAKVEQEKEHFELEKAKEVDKVKSAFFTNISHEFRTPLTLIKGPVEDMLQEFSDHPKVKERLKLVQRNSDLLLKLINQLLDLAKLESGSLTVDKSEADLNSFLAAVTSSFSSFALQKNITLVAEFQDTRYLALFDKDKLETILINLINNAIKFTPAGGKVNVRVNLEKVDHQQNIDQLIFSVSDTGIGISEDQQSKIFERFHQVSEAHKEVGTGIGLALVKELVALLGGKIELKSKPGEGSEFKITLPIEAISFVESKVEVSLEYGNKTEPLERMSNDEYRMMNDEVGDTKPKVLVVEDNGDLRSFIIGSLGEEFHFLEAGDGKQGMEKAFEEVPDLIISDVMMPEMDGITMTGKLKKDTRTSHIPIILLTAKTSEESKLSGLGTGADDYLTKPFNKNELLLKVRNSIALRVKLREKIKLELLKESPKIEVQSADEQFLWKVKEAILARLGDEQLSVESLAEEIGLSRSQLFRKITALTGVSVNELIRTFRLQKAAQLLAQNWAPVTQVAYEVGFSNLSYFSKVFKEQYGVLPSEYSTKV